MAEEHFSWRDNPDADPARRYEVFEVHSGAVVRHSHVKKGAVLICREWNKRPPHPTLCPAGRARPE